MTQGKLGRTVVTKSAVAVFALALASALALVANWRSEEGTSESKLAAPNAAPAGQAHVPLKDWILRLTSNREDGSSTVTILKDGREIYTATASPLLTVTTFGSRGKTTEFFGSAQAEVRGLESDDITGDGVADILLTESCGCSAGFVTYTILSLGRDVEKIFQTDDWVGGWGLRDVDGDGVYEAIGNDFPVTTDYVGAVHPTGPGVQVILEYDHGTFRLCGRLMKRQPPATRDFKAVVERTKKGRSSDAKLPDEAYAYILRSVYSGNGESARKFIDLVLSDKSPNGREFFWRSLYEEMMGSPYWTEIAALNGWAEDQYAFKECPY